MSWLSFSDIQLLASGLQVTLLLALSAMILTLVLGIAVAMFRILAPKSLKWIGALYVDGIRSMPLVLYLVLIFTVLPVPPFERAVFALGTFNAAFVAEIIRSAINSLDRNQIQAAALLGMSPFDVFLSISLPQALGRMIPALINQLNTLLKDTSLVSLGALELAKSGEILIERAWGNAFTVILLIGSIYFVLCFGLSLLGQLAEKTLRPWQPSLQLPD